MVWDRRTHPVLPDDRVEQVDGMAGPRKRSELIERAMRGQVKPERQRWVAQRGPGVLNLTGKDYPRWATPVKVDTWLDEARKVDVERSARRSLRAAAATSPRRTSRSSRPARPYTLWWRG